MEPGGPVRQPKAIVDQNSLSGTKNFASDHFPLFSLSRSPFFLTCRRPTSVPWPLDGDRAENPGPFCSFSPVVGPGPPGWGPGTPPQLRRHAVGDGSRPCQYSLLQEGRRRLPHSTAFQATLEQYFYPFFFGVKGTISRD